MKPTHQTHAGLLRPVLSSEAGSSVYSGAIYISPAFLNAELGPKQMVMTYHPNATARMGLIPEGTNWILRKAMYGRRESPRLQGESRD